MKIQKLLFMAVPLALTAGCVYSHQPSVAYETSHQVTVPAPTSASAAVRVYPEPSPRLSEIDDPDMPLANNVRAAVAGDPSLNAACRNVDIEVVQGRLTLRGTVATEHQRELIEQRLSGLSGVISVDNRVLVTPQ